MLALITLDLDDTLWDNRQTLAEAEQAACARLRPEWPAVAERFGVEELRALRLGLTRDMPELAHRVSWLRREAVRRAAQAAGLPAAEAERCSEAAFAAFAEARSRVRPFPQAMAVLARLRRHCRVAALTNGNVDLARAGLAEAFDFALHAEDPEVDAAKPHPRMFERALALAGCSAAQALHIGDHPRCDVLGARGAAFHTLWYNHSGQPWPEAEFHPDASFSDWGEALALIRARWLPAL